MTILIADNLSAEDLDNIKGPVEIRGHDGKPLGYYLLAKVDSEDTVLGIDEAEARRRAADTSEPKYTAEQVAAKMREIIVS